MARKVLGQSICFTESPSIYVQYLLGVITNQVEIDRIIRDFAVDWSLERMPVVDRNILTMFHLRVVVGAQYSGNGHDQRSR